MARRGLSDIQKQEAAPQGTRRMIARGESPLYRLTVALDGSWTIRRAAGAVRGHGASQDAPGAARAPIVAWLDGEDAFDVET